MTEAEYDRALAGAYGDSLARDEARLGGQLAAFLDQLGGQARYKPCGQPGEHGLAESGEPVTCAMSAHWAAAGHKPWCGANAATPWVAPTSADARCCPLDTRNAANRP